jgi:uncharacterized damage-inducible protein DinB
VTPPDTRPEPPETGDEKRMLDGFLDFHRETLRWKCAELTDEQLRSRPIESTSLSLLGLIRHMADVERSWFVRRFAGQDVPALYWSDDDPDGDFDHVETADIPAAWAAFDRAIAESKAVSDGASLTAEFLHPRHHKTYSLRWVYLHMIEEYARHNGHADLLRERIDGATGDSRKTSDQVAWGA